jgi:hypothetical protein
VSQNSLRPKAYPQAASTLHQTSGDAPFPPPPTPSLRDRLGLILTKLDTMRSYLDHIEGAMNGEEPKESVRPTPSGIDSTMTDLEQLTEHVRLRLEAHMVRL